MSQNDRVFLPEITQHLDESIDIFTRFKLAQKLVISLVMDYYLFGTLILEVIRAHVEKNKRNHDKLEYYANNIMAVLRVEKSSIELNEKLLSQLRDEHCCSQMTKHLWKEKLKQKTFQEAENFCRSGDFKSAFEVLSQGARKYMNTDFLIRLKACTHEDICEEIDFFESLIQFYMDDCMN
jgi:hypothetical protein